MFVVFTSALDFLWNERMFYCAIILKLGLWHVWLFLVSEIWVSFQTYIFNCWCDTIPASFSPVSAAMETHVDVEIPHEAIPGKDATFKNHSYSPDYRWPRKEQGLPSKEEEARLDPRHSHKSQAGLGVLVPPAMGGKSDSSPPACQYSVVSSLCS
jgi:hypothetical protein